MTPLRVAVVLAAASGGTAAHAAMLARGCADIGYEVRAFGPESSRDFFSAPPAGGAQPGARPPAGRPGTVVRFEPVRITSASRPGANAAALWRLRALLRSGGADVVHAHGVRAGAFAALALALLRRSAALVITVHNAAPAGRLPALAYRVLERVCARRADVVLCVSADLCARMRRLRARRIAVAVVPAPPARPPSAAAVAAARAELGAGARPVVLAVGRLAEQKGYRVLLSAAARWQRRQPRPLLVIAGTGPLAGELARSGREQGVDVRFLGQRADVAALLRAADVFVLASSWEGQPLAVQEALQAGTPVVASRAGGVPELTGPGAALLVPPGDPAALAAAVLAVLDDRQLAGALAAAAAARGAQLPSVADAVGAAAAVYLSLAAAARQRRTGIVRRKFRQ